MGATLSTTGSKLRLRLYFRWIGRFKIHTSPLFVHAWEDKKIIKGHKALRKKDSKEQSKQWAMFIIKKEISKIGQVFGAESIKKIKYVNYDKFRNLVYN